MTLTHTHTHTLRTFQTKADWKMIKDTRHASDNCVMLNHSIAYISFVVSSFQVSFWKKKKNKHCSKIDVVEFDWNLAEKYAKHVD